MPVNLSALDRAIEKLRLAISYVGTELVRQDPELLEVCQSAVIQRFEYTYELAVKLLMKVLEQDVALEGTAKLAFKDVMRLAADYRLIDDAESWFKYRKLRDMTSHDYYEVRSKAVLGEVDAFFADVRRLRDNLESASA